MWGPASGNMGDCADASVRDLSPRWTGGAARTAGSGAHDELRYDSAPGEWVWTDGSTRVVERYANSTCASLAWSRRTEAAAVAHRLGS
jgi:hypothetical protein